MSGVVHGELQRGLSALKAGNLKKAEVRFKAVLRAQPKQIAALNLLGVVLTQLGKFAEAEQYLCQALGQNPNSEATLYNYGVVLKSLNRPTEALHQFNCALAINPAVAETWNNRGTVFNQMKRHREAIADFERAIAINPGYADAFFNKGNALADLRSYRQALAAYDRAAALKPDLTDAWLGRGNVLAELKEDDAAFAAYDKALALAPHSAEAWLGRGNLLARKKQYDSAFSAYQRGLALKPDLAEAWLGRGNLLAVLKRYADALAAYGKALDLAPNLARALVARGNVFLLLKQYGAASTDFEKALTLAPDHPAAWRGRGSLFLLLKEYEAALADYEKALALEPDAAESWRSRGNASAVLKRYEAAFADYQKALTLDPEFAEAWLNRANLFLMLKQYDAGFADCEKALALKPDLAEAWLCRGGLLNDLQQYNEALACYDEALAIQPDLAEAWTARGRILFEHGQHADAFLAYDKAVELQPDTNYAAGLRLMAKLYSCDWSNLEADTANLLSLTRRQIPASTPFCLLPVQASVEDQLCAARRYVQEQPSFPPLWRGEIHSHQRIRIAYLSADFREHPVAYLMAGLFEHHNKSIFEITAISLGSDEDTPTRRRLTAAFEHFIDAKDQGEEDIANLLRRLEIDIAVDLMGYTTGGRLGIFARHPVPIQVNYLGYAGTMGGDWSDYILADATVIPEEHCPFYTEQVVWLPNCYLVNDDRRVIAETATSRREAGLPDDGFVFCCFNNSYKLAPATFQVWMRLLNAIPHAVLWLSELSPTAKSNLRREAQRCGVSVERIIFAPRTPHPADHLARLQHADLFLDTLPYNAHTTACDALWTGVPLLTCLGATFAGRVAASLLKAVGLNELVTHSLEEYEALALKLVHDPAYRASLRERLARNRSTCPLFDTARTTRNIEAAYTMMWDRYQEGKISKSGASGAKPIHIPDVVAS